MVYVAQFSDFKNYIKMNNFVPEYARDFKKECLYIKGLNYEFKYFEENKEKLYTYEYFHNANIDRISRLINYL